MTWPTNVAPLAGHSAGLAVNAGPVAIQSFGHPTLPLRLPQSGTLTMQPPARLFILLASLAAIAGITMRRFGNILTTQKLRSDSMGSGEFGAHRHGRTHQGLDLVAVPGEIVRSPVAGRFIRTARPYANDPRYLGCVIQGQGFDVKLFYMEPLPTLKPGDPIAAGQVIGTAQNIAAKYGQAMTPHVHVEVRRTVGAQLLNPANLLTLTT